MRKRGYRSLSTASDSSSTERVKGLLWVHDGGFRHQGPPVHRTTLGLLGGALRGNVHIHEALSTIIVRRHSTLAVCYHHPFGPGGEESCPVIWSL